MPRVSKKTNNINTEKNPRNYLLLHRKLAAWRWKTDPKMLALWIDILLRCQWHEGGFMKEELAPGQCVVGLYSLAESTGLSVRSVRTCLNKLKSTSEVTIKTTNKYSVITVVKWGDYQILPSDSDKHNDKLSDKPTTNKRQTNDNIQEYNNIIRKQHILHRKRAEWVDPEEDEIEQLKLEHLSMDVVKEIQLCKSWYKARGIKLLDWTEARRGWLTRSESSISSKRVDKAPSSNGTGKHFIGHYDVTDFVNEEK